MSCEHGSRPKAGQPDYVWVHGADAIPGDWQAFSTASRLGAVELVNVSSLCSSSPPDFQDFDKSLGLFDLRSRILNNAKAMKWFEVCECVPGDGCYGLTGTEVPRTGGAVRTVYSTVPWVESFWTPQEENAEYWGASYSKWTGSGGWYNFVRGTTSQFAADSSYCASEPPPPPPPSEPPPPPPPPSTPPPTVAPPPPGMCSCLSPPSYHDMSFTSSDRALLSSLVPAVGAIVPLATTAILTPLAAGVAGLATQVASALPVLEAIKLVLDIVRDLTDTDISSEIQADVKKLVALGTCNHLSATAVTSAVASSGRLVGLVNPKMCVVQLDVVPGGGKMQSGGGVAQDLYHAGWVSFLGEYGAYERRPINFKTSCFSIPCFVDEVQWTLTNGATGRIIVFLGDVDLYGS